MLAQAALLALLPAFSLAANATAFIDKLSIREVGSRNTNTWRVWLEKDNEPISPWHDIPLWFSNKDKQVISVWTEIPRWTDAKIETNRDEPLNPIWHDSSAKKGKPKFVYSVWPHKSYPFHYGSIPQTWESPNYNNSYTGLAGDNDPIDVFDISENPATVGQVKQVKILGGLALIDDDYSDWKIMAIDVTDPLADLVHNWDDVEKYRPELTDRLYDWFVYYKVVKGDGKNTIDGNKFQSAKSMVKLVEQSHKYWEQLVKGKSVNSGTINYNQTSNKDYKKSYISSKKAITKFDIPTEDKIVEPAARPTEYDLWYYLDKNDNVISLP